jgi:hypothetical protein
MLVGYIALHTHYVCECLFFYDSLRVGHVATKFGVIILGSGAVTLSSFSWRGRDCVGITFVRKRFRFRTGMICRGDESSVILSSSWLVCKFGMQLILLYKQINLQYTVQK